jgi:hypothetical protein
MKLKVGNLAINCSLLTVLNTVLGLATSFGTNESAYEGSSLTCKCLPNLTMRNGTAFVLSTSNYLVSNGNHKKLVVIEYKG